MKTKKFLAGFLFVIGITAGKAQNVASTSSLTSGGSQAGNQGTGNAFYGYQAGKAVTGYGAATNSTFIGQQAGPGNVGVDNTFVGYRAGYSNFDGSYNVYMGSSAGYQSSDNSNNVFIGYRAGYSSNSSNNTFIGYQAGYNNDNASNIFLGYKAGYNETASNRLYIENSDINTPLIYGNFSTNRLVFNGQVGITNETLANQANLFPTTAGGVNVSAYQLFVKGGILTEEVRVITKNTTNWADYVFEKDYKLLSLKEVESYIEKNGHLPNVPSAKQVKESGIELSEMARIQQEKIEELTLYIIELEKKTERQEKEMKEVKELVVKMLDKK